MIVLFRFIGTKTPSPIPQTLDLRVLAWVRLIAGRQDRHERERSMLGSFLALGTSNINNYPLCIGVGPIRKPNSSIYYRKVKRVIFRDLAVIHDIVRPSAIYVSEMGS